MGLDSESRAQSLNEKVRQVDGKGMGTETDFTVGVKTNEPNLRFLGEVGGV